MLNSPVPSPHRFDDQYAFRKTGSTTAAIIKFFTTITAALRDNEFVRVISLDFSKAFDTVRHQTLMNKLSVLPVPDNVYNWIANFIDNRSHCTLMNREKSSEQQIQASVVQGSAIGPALFICNASDLHEITPGNNLDKYADDTWIVISSKNSDSSAAELENIANWAVENNQKLNKSKSVEIIFTDPANKRTMSFPPEYHEILRNTTSPFTQTVRCYNN